ncbi:MAG TPA: FAD-binding oxidoreductase [Candidatus Dormibacteraeota bacterium]|nr:FAD-binding oxidoreductase [Candidatus Dormibacteraeota bacterium]
MPTTPYWPQPAPRPPVAPPRHVDVVVVGGGITGVCGARELAARGVSVALLERDRLAAGASGRSAGFCLAGVAESYAGAVARHGRGVARDVLAMTRRNHDRLLDLAGGRLPGHRRLGSLVVATSPEEAAELEESGELLAEDGVPARWDPRPGAVPGASHGCLLIPGDGELDPAATVSALAARLDASPSVAICEGVDVTAVTERGGAVEVRTTGGLVTAGAALLAVNARTASLAPGVPIGAVRAQMLATEPVGATIATWPTYARRGFDYWRQLPDGTLLVGGRRDADPDAEVGDEDAATATIQAALDRLRTDLGAGGAAVIRRWSGTMGFAPGGLPLVGAVEPGSRIAVCGGYTGHGLGFAAECSLLAVEVLLDGATPPAHLDVARRPVPAGAGRL